MAAERGPRPEQGDRGTSAFLGGEARIVFWVQAQCDDVPGRQGDRSRHVAGSK
jgi:hypothetical protein